jgi:hypothetical protein
MVTSNAPRKLINQPPSCKGFFQKESSPGLYRLFCMTACKDRFRFWQPFLDIRDTGSVHRMVAQKGEL